MTNGVPLTTGNAQVALGPNSQAGAAINVPTALSGDVDLDLITTNSVEHVSIIEFDFVATGTSLNFDFVFASEEYPEYAIDPDFNDVFGFFLSGPGIAGSFSNGAKNIALIPGASILSRTGFSLQFWVNTVLSLKVQLHQEQQPIM